MENKTQFRSAGFGGFNRQDVLTYIEQTAAETAQQLDELRAQRDEVQGAGGRFKVAAAGPDRGTRRTSGTVRRSVCGAGRSGGPPEEAGTSSATGSAASVSSWTG